MSELLARPSESEYASYYSGYVAAVEGNDVLAELRRRHAEAVATCRSISEEQSNTAYAPGKWTIKQLLSHVIDCERVFAYRALRFSRGDETPIEGFDQDPYVENARLDDYPFASLVDEFDHLRASTIRMVEHIDETGWLARGKANGVDISVRAIVFIVAGHEIHHANILRDRYLAAADSAAS